VCFFDDGSSDSAVVIPDIRRPLAGSAVSGKVALQMPVNHSGGVKNE